MNSHKIADVAQTLRGGKNIAKFIRAGANDEFVIPRAMVRMQSGTFLNFLYGSKDAAKACEALEMIRFAQIHSNRWRWPHVIIRLKYRRFEIGSIVDRIADSSDATVIQRALTNCQWVITGAEYARLQSALGRLENKPYLKAM